MLTNTVLSKSVNGDTCLSLQLKGEAQYTSSSAHSILGG